MAVSHLAVLRVAVGLLQGIVLYLLYHAAEAKAWPATDSMLYAALLVPAVFVPIIAIAGIGSLRARTFALWLLVALIVVRRGRGLRPLS